MVVREPCTQRHCHTDNCLLTEERNTKKLLETIKICIVFIAVLTQIFGVQGQKKIVVNSTEVYDVFSC